MDIPSRGQDAEEGMSRAPFVGTETLGRAIVVAIMVAGLAAGCVATVSPELMVPAGSRHANAGPPTVNGYRLHAICGGGAEFKRWVTLDDADEDLLKSALLAFEN